MNSIGNLSYPFPKQDFKVLVRCFTYNQSKYIEEALTGFAMQKTNFPFVCLVMDDASTDGEQEVIKSWIVRECDMNRAEIIDIPTSVVIIVPHRNNPSCTFAFYLLRINLYNTVERKMNLVYPWREKSQYEALCEGDDYWIDPLKLQRQVDFMDNNPDYSLCFHNAIRLNERVAVKEKIASFCFFHADRQISTEEIIADWCIPTASLLYRREALKDIQLPRFFSGDYTLELTLASIGKVYYMDRYMSVYRINSGGISGGISAKRWAEQLCALLDWFDEFTSYKFKEHVFRRKKGANQFARYCNFKQKNTLLPFVLMPSYMLQKIKQKINEFFE